MSKHLQVDSAATGSLSSAPRSPTGTPLDVAGSDSEPTLPTLPTSTSSLLERKEAGNAHFIAREYELAISCYNEALDSLKVHVASRLPDSVPTSSSSSSPSSERQSQSQSAAFETTVLANRAACYLSTSRYSECIRDCDRVLAIDACHLKAIYRRAEARFKLEDYENCILDLKRLLSIDAKNASGNKLMQTVHAAVKRREQSSSETSKVLLAMMQQNDTTRTDTDNSLSVPVSEGLRYLTSLCIDDVHHAMELTKQGLGYINTIANRQYEESAVATPSGNTGGDLLSVLKLWTALCGHIKVIESAVDFNNHFDATESKIFFSFACTILGNSKVGPLVHAAITLVMTIIRTIPLFSPTFHSQHAISDGAASTCRPENLFLQTSAYNALLHALALHLTVNHPFETHAYAIDLLSVFVSEDVDFFHAPKQTDYRLETLEARKLRHLQSSHAKLRASLHATAAASNVTSGALRSLCGVMGSENSLLRQKASSCFGRIAIALGDDTAIKGTLARLLEALTGSFDATDEADAQAHPQVVDLDDLPSPIQCRQRAVIESSMLVARPEIGTWLLGRRGGIEQLFLLLSSYEAIDQEIASEVLCLAANTDMGASLLSPFLSSGIVHKLLQSANCSIRAAAASTIVKLSVKAKALTEGSQEIVQILGSVSSVIATSAKAMKADGSGASENTGSASKLTKANTTKPMVPTDHNNSKESATTVTSFERVVEVLAAIIGKHYIKEEILYGSSRVVAIVPALLSMAATVDMRSTAAFGISHVLAALSITNYELRAKALAEKDMTPEQFEQLQQLQRIHTKDDDGNVVEEKSEETHDPDTTDQCRERIRRLVSLDGIPVLLRFLTGGSQQTKEAASRALCQMCVVESTRGLAIQQGLLKVCSNEALDDQVAKLCRLQSAHAVAKCLVTTDPHLIPEHTRSSCLRSLIYLCSDSDATNLQQFEALLSLTNLISLGEDIHDTFVHEKGVSTVHYLMFSDHFMVRRAATELFCNMPYHEAVLKILRDPEKVRLWLAISEDWNNANAPQESMMAARAAVGTLAIATNDEDVAKAMLQESCGEVVVALLRSANIELVHRALVLVSNLCEGGGKALAQHLVMCGVVPEIAVVTKLGDSQLVELAKSTAKTISDAMNSRVEELP